MNNLQLYLSIGIPTVAVLASLVVSISVTMMQSSGLRELIGANRDLSTNQSENLRGDMRELRQDVRELRQDVKLLTGKVFEIDNRLTVLENR